MRRSVFGNLLIVLLILALASLGLSLIGRYVVTKFQEEETTEETIKHESTLETSAEEATETPLANEAIQLPIILE